MLINKIDWKLLAPTLLLSLTGLTLMRGVAPQLLANQALFFIAAGIVYLIVRKVGHEIFIAFIKIEYILSIIFLISPFILGVASRGATRWLQIGSFSIQPSEIVKPFLILIFAHIAAGDSSKKWLFLIMSAFLPMCIIFLQPDLGTTLVLMSGWATIFFSLGRLKNILITLFLALTMLFPVYNYILQPFQRDRLTTFINPYADPLGRGYHVIQSVIAVGSGGLFGRGLGHGTQSELRFLPEHHTDFIFASLSESLGFVGAMIVISLYLILIWRIYRISQTTSSRTMAFFCAAVASLIAFQIFVNIGMNIGIMPVTGITLPLLSYGGSSLLSFGIILGLVASTSTNPRTP